MCLIACAALACETAQNQILACCWALDKQKEVAPLKETECSFSLTCLCECIPSQKKKGSRLFFFLLFSQRTGRRRQREREPEWVGDWINYVLSPFSWLKSTLLPLDSLCLCLRRRQMDRACHPVQALPSLLSETWTFRSESSGCVVSWCLSCFCVFFFVFHSFFLSNLSPSKNESGALLFITHTMICGNTFSFSEAPYVHQERWVAPGVVYRISHITKKQYENCFLFSSLINQTPIFF